MTMTEDDRARGDALARSFLQGNIDRRAFLRRAGALGGAAAGSGLSTERIRATTTVSGTAIRRGAAISASSLPQVDLDKSSPSSRRPHFALVRCTPRHLELTRSHLN